MYSVGYADQRSYRILKKTLLPSGGATKLSLKTRAGFTKIFKRGLTLQNNLSNAT